MVIGNDLRENMTLWGRAQTHHTRSTKIKDYPNAKFEVNGHTDNVGKPASNKKLSEARAKAVVDALVARGINPANLTAQGFGDTKPVASNKTAKGRAENRRTEVIYVGGPSGMKVNRLP